MKISAKIFSSVLFLGAGVSWAQMPGSNPATLFPTGGPPMPTMNAPGAPIYAPQQGMGEVPAYAPQAGGNGCTTDRGDYTRVINTPEGPRMVDPAGHY